MRNTREDGFSILLAVVAVLVLTIVGLVGWKVIDAGHNSRNASKLKDSKITQGLPAAGASERNNDLVVLSNSDILNEETPPASVHSGDVSVGISLIDRRGYNLNMPGIQINTEPGKTYEPIDLLIKTQGVSTSDCTITHTFVPDEDNATPTTSTLPSSAKQRVDVYDGVHSFKATCNTDDTPVTAGFDFRIADGIPKKCKGWSFTDSNITATSYETLKTGIVGTWEGCVKFQGGPSYYYVTMHINADGTYSAVSGETLDGVKMNAMYYGSEQDSPLKKYFINDFQANNTGIGDIDIVFDTNNVSRGALKNIKLMGDKLSFDFYHRNQYGPFTYELLRK